MLSCLGLGGRGAAANKKRTETNEAKRKGKMTAVDVIRGDSNMAATGDGTEALTATSDIPFPSDKYQTDITVPALDRALKGKKIMCLFDDQDGKGLQYKPFNMKGTKRSERADATGVALEAPMFGFKLQCGESGESFKSKLLPEQYGINKKWYMAVKKKAKKK